MRGSEFRTVTILLGVVLTALLFGAPLLANDPGLPFTEDFSDTDLRDAANTNANWSTEEQALFLAWKRKATPWASEQATGSDITTDEPKTTRAIALGDVDGDGDVDLVEGNGAVDQEESKNIVYLNNGTDNPWDGVSGTVITNNEDDTRTVVLGDVDRDGDLDLVVGNFDSANRLYLNNGTGNPWSGAVGLLITTDADDTSSVALGDVDGDGDLDLVAGNFNQRNRLYLNNGTPDPWAGVTGSDITTDSNFTTSVALGDLDGDGHLDLVAGNQNQAKRSYLNNGTDDPWAGVSGTNITNDTNITFSVALADLDGDGDLDLVSGNFNQNNRMYLNNGTADPWSGIAGSNITSDTGTTRSVALGDLDGDGDLDLVAGNSSGTTRVYRNNGTPDPWSGVAGADITDDIDDTRAVALADLNGDGALDVATGNDLEPNRQYLNNGTADPYFSNPGSDITIDVDNTLSVALGDVDRDGDLDLVTGNYAQTNVLYLNNGTDDPWFGVLGSDITADADNTRSIVLGDVDRDGDLDLVAGAFAGTTRLYLNNGTADPWSGVTGSDITADADDTWSVVLGDVDGDGDLDLVVGNFSDCTPPPPPCLDGTTRLYLNNGTSDPWAGAVGSNVTTDVTDTRSLALGDVDRDGDLDVVAGNFGEINRYYLNQLTDAQTPWVGKDFASDAGNTRSVALGDVDGDGNLDAVVGNSAGVNRLYLNNGSSLPWDGVPGSNVTNDVNDTHSVVLGDVDRDGDLDLMAGNDGETTRMYLNNGTFNPWSGVTGSDITPDADETLSIALGDVDGNGSLDLVAGNQIQINRSYLNNGSVDTWIGARSSEVTSEVYATSSVAVGDVDGDGDLDLVAGNDLQTNRLYTNNGTRDPWDAVTGSDISDDTAGTRSVALGDVDRDGDLDLVAGDSGGTNRLYLNNGTALPWFNAMGSDITADSADTRSVALGDVDRDGDLDLVAGNSGGTTRLYLNNGTALPWDGVSGSDITTDVNDTRSVVLGDVDRDGDLDLVVGNVGETNRLYLNNGTSDPWGGVSGSDITADVGDTLSVVLGDADGDGDPDLVAGNDGEANRLYLNNGTADPWGGVSGSDITADADDTSSATLADVDSDGDLDLLAGNADQTNRLYANNGTSDPWAGVAGLDLTTDAADTRSLVVADVDADGVPDLMTGDDSEANHQYRGSFFYDTSRGRGTSLEVDTQAATITNAFLTGVDAFPGNTQVDYWLSNDGGLRWYLVRPGVRFWFDTTGSDLRWRAELRSLSPGRSPLVDEIHLSTLDSTQPATIGDRVWHDLNGDGIQDPGEPGVISALVYLYDAQGGIVDLTFTDVNGDYAFPNAIWRNQTYQVRFIPPVGAVLAPKNQGADGEADSDADPMTGFTEPFDVLILSDATRWDAGMVSSTGPCFPPDELLYIYEIGMTPSDFPILNWYDWNQPTQITGYNVYRSSDAGLPHDQWDLVASDIVDGDEGTPNNQWIDQSGEPGLLFYQVAAYNHHCPPETAEGPW